MGYLDELYLCLLINFFSYKILLCFVYVQFMPQVVVVSCGLDSAIGDEKVLTYIC